MCSNNLEDDKFNEITFLDVLNIYQNLNLIKEPKIPFPQSDNFEIFVTICEKIYECEKLSRDEIMKIFDILPRQYSFYISAGNYLGLFKKEKVTNIYLSNKGRGIFSLNDKQKKLALVKLILQHKPFYDVFTVYLDYFVVPDTNDIFLILKKSELYNINSDVTLKRRSTTVKNWINWIVNLY